MSHVSPSRALTPKPQLLLLLLLLLLLGSLFGCSHGLLAAIYRGREAGPTGSQFLSDHAFCVRRNRIIPSVILQYSDQPGPDKQHQLPAAFEATSKLRAVILPAENEAQLTRFAEVFSTGDPAVRRRLFIGLSLRHSAERFTGPRFLRLLQLLGTSYLDLLLVSGRPCGHSRRDRLACGRNSLTPAFLRNWRTLLRLAKKKRILNLGVRNYPLPAVRQLHRLSTPECLDFPDRPGCSALLKFARKGEKPKALTEEPEKKIKTKADPAKKRKKQKSAHGEPACAAKGRINMHNAYSMRRAAGNVNFLTIAQAAFNPHHRHRMLRRWCHRHSVVLLADEATGGPHADELLSDARLLAAAEEARLPIRTAILHWAMKKRVSVAVGPEEGAEFVGQLGNLASATQHLVGIDRTVESDVEARYFLASKRGRGLHDERRWEHLEL